MGRQRQACVDCHFFVRGFRDPGTGVGHTLDVGREQRDSSRSNDYSWRLTGETLKCDFGVWDEGFQPDPSQRHDRVVNTDRADFCFFWPWRPGMLLPAARVLQERAAAGREANRDRRLTVWGLWIAVAALVVNIIVTWWK